MSAFQVGDRVRCTCSMEMCSVRGVVEDVDGATTGLRCDDGAVIDWATAALALVAPAPPVAVAPTLETATGAELDRIAEDRFMTLRWTGETDMALRYRCQRIRATSGVTAPAGYELKTVIATGLPNPPPPVLTFTAALPVAPSGIDRDVADYVAEHDRMRAALDTVRRFLGSHSFASCSLACNREMREVMAVVLAALDADKAAK